MQDILLRTIIIMLNTGKVVVEMMCIYLNMYIPFYKEGGITKHCLPMQYLLLIVVNYYY